MLAEAKASGDHDTFWCSEWKLHFVQICVIIEKGQSAVHCQSIVVFVHFTISRHSVA